MDLVCHENLDSDHHHHQLHLKQQHQQQSHHPIKIYPHDDYMSSSSNSSYSYSLSPPPSQYSITSSTSSGIGSLVGTEDSNCNFGDLTRSNSHCSLIGESSTSGSSSFANFRQYSPQVVEEEVVVSSEEHEVEIVERVVVQEEVVVELIEEHHQQQQHEPPQQSQSQPPRTRAQKRSQQSSAAAMYYNHQPKIRKADRDPVFLENRCLANLFELEAQLYHSTRGHMKGDINEQMRRIVAGWMMELCEGRSCQEEVCLLALNYMDRYLIVCEVKKNHLQLLAAACLLLASKLREPSSTSLTADILVYFTDNSITKIDLIQWELLVLSALKWDISVVTPLDFLEHFLSRLAIRDLDVEKVRTHAQAFICLAAQEHFMETSSTVAAASLAVSINGLHSRENDEDAGLLIVNRLVDKSVSMGKLELESVIVCMNRMESIYEDQKNKLVADYILNTPPNSPVNNSNNGKEGGNRDGQVVPATPQKCPNPDHGDGSESEGDIKF